MSPSLNDYGQTPPHHPCRIVPLSSLPVGHSSSIAFFSFPLSCLTATTKNKTKHAHHHLCVLFSFCLCALNQADSRTSNGDIYAASEAPIPGSTSEALSSAIRLAGHKKVHYFRTMQEIEFSAEKCRAPGAGQFPPPPSHRRRNRQPREQREFGLTRNGAPHTPCALRTFSKLLLLAAVAELGVDSRPLLCPNTLRSAIGGTTDLLLIRKHESIQGLFRLSKITHNVPHQFFLGDWLKLTLGGRRTPLGRPPTRASRA